MLKSLKSMLSMPEKNLKQELNHLAEVLSEIKINKDQDIDRIISTFTQQESNILQQLEHLEQKCIVMEEKIQSLQKIINDCQHKEDYFKKMCSNIMNTNEPIYWSNKFEKDVVIKNWGKVTDRPDFPEKFIKLIRNLDDKSVENVIRILIRQKTYLESDQEELDLFTRSEQEELRLLQENFNSEILKVSDNLYTYKGYFLPINHFESSVFYYKHGLENVQTLDKIKDKAILDIGGFIGDSVLIFSKLNPKQIYTFEALPDNFKLLQQTLKLNHVKNVIAENVALGSKSGSCIMHIAGSGTTSIERPGIRYSGNIEVPVITLDDYVKHHNIEVGLIKVDIEGGEPDFLAGAKYTICTQKPIILLSIYHNAHDFFELKPLIESWNLGYNFKIYKPTIKSATGETLLIAEII